VSSPNRRPTAGVHYQFATQSDSALVREFIDRHWRRGHVLARDERLLLWQHRGPGDRLNFVLGERDGEVLGILGFIDSSRFDPHDTPGSVSLTTWVTRTDVPTTGVGTGLLRFLDRERRADLLSTIGVAVDAQRLLGALSFATGEMAHRVVLNAARPSWSVASVGTSSPAPIVESHSAGSVRAVVGRIGSWQYDYADLLSSHNASTIPRKSIGYLEARFADHPAYDYWSLTLIRRGEPICLLICRSIDVEGTIVARCVDKIGDLAVEGASAAIHGVLVERDLEYLDFVFHGAATDRSLPEGFLVVRPESGPWVPGFFEPYRREHRTLRYAHRIRATVQDVELWMADSDQDRPSETHSDG